jgi:hypothetical protein
MKTAGRGTQKRYATLRSEPSSWGGRREEILLNDTGWKARKNPVAGEIVFLKFPLDRTYRELAVAAAARADYW